jgi:hypothetical protein
MKNISRAIFMYTLSLLVLYGAYVNTGGFYNVTVFYLWIVSALLIISTIAIATDEKILYEVAKDHYNYPQLYYSGLTSIEFGTIVVLAYNSHYFYATMLLIMWLTAENIMNKVRKFDVQKYEEKLKTREEFFARIEKRFDDMAKS